MNCLQHVRSSGLGAIVCKSHATHRVLIMCNMLCFVPRGTKRQLSYWVWQSLNRIYLSFISLAEPLTDEGGQKTKAPGDSPWWWASLTDESIGLAGVGLSPWLVVLCCRAVSPHEPAPYNLHNSMFTDTIKKMSTEEQQAKWLPLVESYRWVGTYAQTELGHGESKVFELCSLLVGWLLNVPATC